jgi:hypothetical protein
MVSSRHQLKPRSDGRIFIDRDGEVFKFILNYLRDGDLVVDCLDSGLKERLKCEAAYFCLPELERKLSTGATEDRLPPSVYLRVLWSTFAYYDDPSPMRLLGPDPLDIHARLPKREVKREIPPPPWFVWYALFCSVGF